MLNKKKAKNKVFVIYSAAVLVVASVLIVLFIPVLIDMKGRVIWDF